ncbi:MAG: DNA mismatch repair protein MutL [Deltaproteobacteria bacterium]|nr:MAG: DNA mismatch repair protein MutL [Deltaproteobacteria bacterium]
MPKIRILPEQIANQIAAGEVVERPASVVKELLENSLDAGASRIEIEIEGGGTRLIRVIDDGEGMDEDDLLLCLERHGTSKILEAEDLQTIATLGFRGEAIPSIGSVSNLTIKSRTREAELGTQAVLQYGKLQKVHETGCSYGTMIEVKNLFGNTPARRKFLRTVRTELGHIEETIKNYALAAPEATFILRINGRETIYLDGSVDLEGRVKSILHYQDDLLRVTGENSSIGYKLHGYLVPPDKSVSMAARLRFFVNGRAIRDKILTHAVGEGLRGFLMKGKNPAGFFHLSLPPGEVDVNVHPAKHEVRFKTSRDVHQLITSAIVKTMQDYQDEVRTALFGADRDSESIPLDAEAAEPFYPQPEEEIEDEAEDLSPMIGHLPAGDEPFLTRGQASERGEEIEREEIPAPDETDEPAGQGFAPPVTPAEITVKEPEAVYHAPAAEKGRHDFRIIGQLQNLYILCENKQGLLVIDQHAAHERLLFEKLRQQYLSGRVISQNLLFPETVELSVFQAQLVEKNLDELERLGFAVRNFGGSSFVISAVPALAGKAAPAALLTRVLERFGSETKSSEGAGLLEDILADMACKAAIKSGHDLQEIEIEKLLSQMAAADLFTHCPHGRPVFRQFNQNEIKKWFHRT